MQGSKKAILEAICKKNNFGVGIFYGLSGDALAVADYYIADPKLEAFVADSKKSPVKKGSGLRGRVWDTAGHEWQDNVQKLDEKTYARKKLAVSNGLKACVGVAVKEGGKVVGVMEFYSKDEKKEDAAIVAAIKKDVQK